EKALTEQLGVRSFFYKNRTKEELDLPKPEHKEVVVNEYGNKFLINLSDYLDTGLFLDHRETRKWISEQSRGKVVLNTFAYTGSFSIYAAHGGAEKTYSVDLSRTYTEWTRKNLELNDMPSEKNWTYKMDTFEFFRYAKRKKLVFDIIIIDPPTFSRNKGTAFSVQNDHPRLINEALELLTSDGFIVFSNNYHDFRMETKKLTSCKVEELNMIPPDFEKDFAHFCYKITR
ncbi:MAG: class I SAM-dependent methyltransferase, partial [Patescibacteria group bacterium]